MKNKFLLFLLSSVFTISLSQASTIPDAYSGATPTTTYSWNTDDSGAYLIESEADLIKLAEATNEGASTIYNGIDYTGVTFRLTKDLDLSDYANFQPIGGAPAFNGTFHGDGYVITNLTINKSLSYAGLFAQVGSNGLVEQLGVETSTAGIKNTSSTGSTGILVGSNAGTISQCYAKGTVSAKGGDTGGLVGGNGYFGSSSALVKNSYAIATVAGGTGSMDTSGGLVGYNYNTIQSSYAVATVIGGTYKGAFLGRNRNSASTEFAGCYYEAKTGINGHGGGTANNLTSLTASQMQGTETAPAGMAALDFTETWLAQENDYPTLQVFYRAPTYEVTFEPATGASPVYDAGTEIVVEGDDFSFSITKDAEYEHYNIEVTANGNIVTPENDVYTIEDIQEDIVVSITLTPITYEVSFEPITGASAVYDAGTEIVIHGNDFSFSITKDAECLNHSVEVTANGNIITPQDEIYTIEDIQEDVVVNIVLTPAQTTSTANVKSESNRIWTASNTIHMQLTEKTGVQVYNIQGSLLYSSTYNAGKFAISLPQGTYIVKTAQGATKVIVK